MATQDIRVWDGSAWVSIQGPDGASVSNATATATTVVPVNNTTLGSADASVVATPDANGDLTLAFDFKIPAGLPGADGVIGSDGQNATVSVNSVKTNTLAADQQASVIVDDLTQLNPSDLTLDFTFNIPKGKDGTGVNILGSYPTEGDLNTAHPIGNPGDAYLVQGDLYVWDAENDQWLNVGNIQGPAGTDAQVQVGNVQTAELPCGQNASVTVQPGLGSTPSNLTLDFGFGIPSGCDGQDGQNATISLGSVTVNSVCTGLEGGSFTQSGGTASDPIYDLTLDVPTFRAESSPEGSAPSSPCPGTMWIVTGP